MISPFALVVALGAAAPAPNSLLVEKGRQVAANASPKCVMCHMLEGRGNSRVKLDGVAGRLSAEEIKAWVRTPREMAKKKGSTLQPAMLPYPKERLSDADLEALTAYLLSLR
jgi:cytochrome c553